jgi:hypothetical protein
MRADEEVNAVMVCVAVVCKAKWSIFGGFGHATSAGHLSLARWNALRLR